MKQLLILIAFLFLLGIDSLMAQSKKELQDHNDLLKQQLLFLKSQNDSMNQKIILSDYFIKHFRETYLPVNSNPSLAYTQYYLDSLLTIKPEEEPVKSSTDSLLILRDSLMEFQQMYDTLKFENKVFRDILGILIDEKNYPRSEEDFMGEWQFFINPIFIKQDSLYRGLVTYSRMNLSDDILKGMIKQITFMEDELANILYYDGNNEKCFFEVNNFSKTNTYSIHFDRKDEINIELMVTHLPNGIQVSYQSENNKNKDLFYLGYMKR